jgi:hypothetical protein
MIYQASAASIDGRPADVDVEGTEDFGPHEHVERTGICVLCGAWLPSARCLAADCEWRAPRGPETLRAAVAHRVSCGHTVRVLVG